MGGLQPVEPLGGATGARAGPPEREREEEDGERRRAEGERAPGEGEPITTTACMVPPEIDAGDRKEANRGPSDHVPVRFAALGSGGGP